MDQSEFIKKIKEIDDTILSAEKERSTLLGRYISENREFNDGDKVLVHRKGKDPHVAFIKECICHMDGTLEYSFKESKKNGERSKNDFWTYDYLKITMFEG